MGEMNGGVIGFVSRQIISRIGWGTMTVLSPRFIHLPKPVPMKHSRTGEAHTFIEKGILPGAQSHQLKVAHVPG